MAKNRYFLKWFGARFSKAKEAAAKKVGNTIKKVGLAFVRGGKAGRDKFEGPEGFDFNEIERAYLTDSYIRAAIDKYVDFIFKAGWDITGKNPEAVRYIKQRFSIMAQATQTPTEQLFIDIAEELVKYHNVFIVKARASGGYSFPPGVRVAPINGKKPIAGYFILPTSTIEIARDANGTVKKYRQVVQGADKPLEIKPDDMIHIYVDRQPGRAFGFPFLWEVLDDVKLLRQIEELTDKMIYKNIFPLYAYQVGLEKEGFQATDEEIEQVREMLGELTLDGGIVHPERHKIYVVGAEGKALNVEGYLKYFERRVFTGLGVSETLMGRGDTANRSTSDNMDAAFKDRIKAYQKVIATFINSFMINELLVEGGFDPIMNPEDVVEFRFREIDFDSKIKEENHAIQKFTQNAITHEELRTILGLDPITEDEEKRLYFNMISAKLKGTDVEKLQQAANNQGDNKDRPANQYGKKDAPGRKEGIIENVRKSNDFRASLESRWELAKIEFIETVRKKRKLGKSEIKLVTNMYLKSTAKLTEKYITKSFLEGLNSFSKQSGISSSIRYNYSGTIKNITYQCNKSLEDLLSKDLTNKLIKATNKYEGTDLIASIVAIFDSLKYKVRFIANTESSRAYNTGFISGARKAGIRKLLIESSEGCEICQSMNGKEVSVYSNKLPPFHPNCSCRVTYKKEGS